MPRLNPEIKISRSMMMLVILFCVGLINTHAVIADDAIQSITARGVLKIGIDIPYGVMEFYDAEGNPSGIDVDIAKAISRKLGVETEFHTMPFDELFEALKSGKVDLLLSAVTITPERQKEMRFSAPYMDVGLSLAVAEGTTDISSKADLKGKRMGVLKGTTGEKFARKAPEIDNQLIHVFANNTERLDALRQGKIDAVIVHFLKEKIPGVKIIGEPLKQSYYGVVGRLTNEELMQEVDSLLREMKRNGRLAEIKREYVN